MKYLIRYTSEHTLVVEADSEDQALDIAERAAADDWEKTEGRFEVDHEASV